MKNTGKVSQFMSTGALVADVCTRKVYVYSIQYTLPYFTLKDVKVFKILEHVAKIITLRLLNFNTVKNILNISYFFVRYHKNFKVTEAYSSFI